MTEKLLLGKYVCVIALANGQQLVFEEMGNPEERARELRDIIANKGVIQFHEDGAFHNIRAEFIGTASTMSRDRFDQLQQRARLMAGAQQRVQ